jgi:hypothetical protein
MMCSAFEKSLLEQLCSQFIGFLLREKGYFEYRSIIDFHRIRLSCSPRLLSLAKDYDETKKTT